MLPMASTGRSRFFQKRNLPLHWGFTSFLSFLCFLQLGRLPPREGYRRTGLLSTHNFVGPGELDSDYMQEQMMLSVHVPTTSGGGFNLIIVVPILRVMIAVEDNTW